MVHQGVWALELQQGAETAPQRVALEQALRLSYWPQASMRANGYRWKDYWALVDTAKTACPQQRTYLNQGCLGLRLQARQSDR